MSPIAFAIILVLLLGGFWGYGRGYGPYSFSPVGAFIIILVVLLLTGVR